MSVARARDLLYQLMALEDQALQDLQNNFQSASNRAAIRALLPNFQDVSGEDMLQAIGSEVVSNIVDNQDLTEKQKRIFPLVTVFADGIPPCCPPHHHH